LKSRAHAARRRSVTVAAPTAAFDTAEYIEAGAQLIDAGAGWAPETACYST
jgi:hypothetical protein